MINGFLRMVQVKSKKTKMNKISKRFNKTKKDQNMTIRKMRMMTK